MAEWTEKCLTCAKAGSIPKWGWSFSCSDEKCEYIPRDAIEAVTTVASSEQHQKDTKKTRGK